MTRPDTPEPYPAPTAEPPRDAAGARRASRAFDWVPIRAMSARHRPRVLKHLLALGPHDRWLRFGSAASDAQITHYVDLIDFDSDEVFGIFNRRLELLAVAHLAYGRRTSDDREPASGARPLRQAQDRPSDATDSSLGGQRAQRAWGPVSTEFGVSVAAHARGRGWGTRLFERAALHARNRGVGRLTIHALSENHPMLLIARKAGAIVVRDGSESQADVILPPGDLGSHVEQLVEDAAAALDFRLKANAKRVGEWMASFSADRADH